MGSDVDSHDRETVRPDYRHAYPVILMVCFLAVAAFLVRGWMIPATFGQYGYYRGAALEDARGMPLRYAGSAACVECHGDVAALHDKDAHGSVQCETCHGPGTQHIRDNDVKMPLANAKEDCLICHRRMDARPGTFPQVDWQEHFLFVGVSNPATACVQCHSGHEPLFMDRDMRKARLHPLVHQCGDCHLQLADTTIPHPEKHPQIFECDYCHPAIAKSQAKSSHRKMACTACHLFIKENSFSGRIIRNADPRFCLLCHRQAPFRSAKGPPVINWPAHIKDVSNDAPDAGRSCAECHQENIHDMPSRAKGVSHEL